MPTDTLARLQLPKRAFAIVLAGGRGSRLKQLTDRRAKPAVYFGGKFRIIDFSLSNCLNSGIRQIGVATQYQSHSLLRHLQRGWSFLKTRNERIHRPDAGAAAHRRDRVVPRHGGCGATEPAISSARKKPQFIVVLAGDHVYKMDYSLLLTDHVERGAQCTVACIEVPIAEATGFGVMAADRSRRITDFVEKPPKPPAMQGKPDRALASMGVYVFNAQYLYDMLEQRSGRSRSNHDFGKDIVPRAVRNGEAVAHPFSQSCVSNDINHEPYWRDVGTIDAYWEANIDLTAINPLLDMYDASWPILTYQEQLAPAKFVFNQEGRRGTALDSLVSGGCIISGSRVERSLLFSRCRVNSYCDLHEAVLLPEVIVGRHARLKRVVIDHGCIFRRGW